MVGALLSLILIGVLSSQHLSPDRKRTQTLESPRLPPSLMAKLLFCTAYVPSPFREEDRTRVMGLHAVAMVRAIGRQLRRGYILEAVELYVNHSRIDLVFRTLDGKRRIHEVKSSRDLTELSKIQAALYWREKEFDEVVLSNGQTDIVLPPDYVQSIQARAASTREFIAHYPEAAKIEYHPNSETCRTCANEDCPFYPSRNYQ
jgi:hypothetical protein